MLSLLACLALPPALEVLEQRLTITELRTAKTYQETLYDAEFAITEHNLRITGRLRIGEAIRERGYPDFPRHDVLLFCNLEFARRLLQREPRGIHHCPARLSLREEDGAVVVSAPLFPESAEDPETRRITARFNDTLRAILYYAAEH